MPSRREVLATLASGTAVGLAGCSTVSVSADAPPAPATPPLEPDKQVYGSDGSWSSFGCNAGNTRSVHGTHAGDAPVDGVSEDWRVPVPQLHQTAPVVADSRVYLPSGNRMRVFDAADGTELWAVDGVEDAPVVRDETVYIADRSTPAVRALAVEDGEERWNVELSAPPAGPSQYPGAPVIVGAGEQIRALDPQTGETVWSRRVFGNALAHPPVWNGFAVAVTTEAGEVSLLNLQSGTGYRRYRLPSAPVCPPSADSDSVYVCCRDGKTYALDAEADAPREPQWTVDTGWTPRGIGIDGGLVFAGTSRDLHAIDSESGTVRWTHGLGDWRHTAPAIGRETVFVGGDRLWALATSSSGMTGTGPAVRFDHSFHGRVGPGPVLDDGTVYVVAVTGEASAHLLALS